MSSCGDSLPGDDSSPLGDKSIPLFTKIYSPSKSGVRVMIRWDDATKTRQRREDATTRCPTTQPKVRLDGKKVIFRERRPHHIDGTQIMRISRIQWRTFSLEMIMKKIEKGWTRFIFLPAETEKAMRTQHEWHFALSKTGRLVWEVISQSAGINLLIYLCRR